MNLSIINTLLRHAHQHNEPTPSSIDMISISVAKPPILVETLTQHTMIAFVLSGEQEIFLGEHYYTVQAGDVFFVPFHLPIKVHFKLDRRPQFLSLSLILDENWLSNIIQKVQTNQTIPPKTQPRHEPNALSGVAVAGINTPTQNCLIRIIEQLDDPNIALTELYKEELIVHLLSTPIGARLIAFASKDSHLHKIKKASEYLHAHFADKISVSELAVLAGMGESSFYEYFKAMTGFSPRQYQKQLRLNHAKSLISNEKIPISQVAYDVGYESISQFSREYKRAFGASPSTQKE